MSKEFWKMFTAFFLASSLVWGIVLTVEHFESKETNCILDGFHLRG